MNRFLPSAAFAIALSTAAFSGGCVTDRKPQSLQPSQTSLQVELLVRDGCAMSQDLERRLAVVLERRSRTFVVVNQDDLPSDDARVGYPTPTILVAGSDLFGLPRATAPFPAPT